MRTKERIIKIREKRATRTEKTGASNTGLSITT